MHNRLVLDEKERVGAWVAERVEQSAGWGDFYAMGAERNGELVAGVVLNNYNGANATAHICVTKPGKDMLLLFREFCVYAFRIAKLKRITGLVPADKPRVYAFDKHLGFEDEFVMRGAAPGGVDMHVLVMWHDKCPWLEK